LRRRLEGLGLSAEPGGFDAVPTQTLIDPAGDGFDFRQFGHGNLLSLSQVLGRDPVALYHQESEPAAPFAPDWSAIFPLNPCAGLKKFDQEAEPAGEECVTRN
jgi:hypothetical protein